MIWPWRSCQAIPAAWSWSGACLPQSMSQRRPERSVIIEQVVP